jgi:hypothetical protein
MGSLLQRVKDLSLDVRGDIRLIPDPRYFAAHPDLRDLTIELAQLRLRSHAGLYVLLLPRRNVENENISKHKITFDNLAHHYWKKVKEVLKGYIHESLIARRIIREKRPGSVVNIFEIMEEEDDETIKAFSRWLNTFEPINYKFYRYSS